MNQKKISIIVFVVLLLFISGLLLMKPFIGLADNGDYIRVLQPLGIIADNYPRFFYALSTFNLAFVNNDTSFVSAIQHIIAPNVENIQEYSSTQFIFIKLALLANYVVKSIFNKDTSIFDIRFLGLLYLFFYAIGLYLFMMKSKFQRPKIKILHIILTVLIFCDIGYLIYFHSFFGEATILVSFLLIVGLLTWILNDNKETKLPLIFFFIASIIYIGAKVANTPIGVLLGIFSLLFLYIRKNNISRVIIGLGAVSLILFSVISYLEAPTWMKKVNNYNTIFFGVLKDSPTPEKDLRDLGIDEKYAALKDTHGFMGAADVYGEELTKEVYDKAGYIDVLMFYITHPSRLIEKLKFSADSSVYLKPAYLNNYEKSYSEESLLFTERFSLWENLRKKTVGYAFYIILVYGLIYFSVIVYKFILFYRTREKDYHQLLKLYANLLLVIVTASQFVIPVVGNGEADLAKHMFLFNACFDLMIILGITSFIDRWKWRLSSLNRKHIYSGVAVLLVIFILFNSHHIVTLFGTKSKDTLYVGDIVQIGQYQGKPLKWTVIDFDETNGYLLWLSEPITNRAFDSDSNLWQDSDIRKWLNEDFMISFSEDDKELIQLTQLKNILPYNHLDKSVGGDRPFFWSSVITYVDQNYDSAYYNTTNDKIFLLDVDQLRRAYMNGISIEHNTEYWLRTPYYSTANMVRTVGKDGFVPHKLTNVWHVAVVPAFYLKPIIKISDGKGSKKSPHLLQK